MEKKNLSQKIKIIVGFNGKPISEKIYTQFPIQMGRDEDNDLVLDYGFVSRKHCEIIEDQGKFQLLDLNSRNGIYVDGKLGRIFEITDSLEFQVNVVSIQILVWNAKNIAEELRMREEKTVVEKTRAENKKNIELAQKAKLQAAAKANEQIKAKAPPVSGINLKANPNAVRNENLRHVVKESAKEQAKEYAKEVPPIPSSAAMAEEIIPYDDDEHGYRPLITENLKSDLIGFHPKVFSAGDKRVEVVVVWQNEIIQVREFEESEAITIGPSLDAEIQIPFLTGFWKLADVNFADSIYHVYKGLSFALSNDGLTWSEHQIQSANPQSYKLTSSEMVRFQIAPWLKVYLRYVPAQERLTRKKLSEPEKDFRNAVIGSTLAHFGLSFLLAFTVPKVKPPAKAKVVQERFARIIVPPAPIIPPPVVIEEPKPIIEAIQPIPEPPKPVVQEPPPKPKVEKPVVVKKKPEKPKPIVEKKPIPKPIQKVAQKPEPKPVQNVVQNRVQAQPSPVKVQPVAVVKPPPPKPAVKVESLGALAALGLGTGGASPNAKAEPVKININSNGATSKAGRTASVNSVVSGLPTASGNLSSGGGGGSIKTKGNSSGVGTGYGTQGLSSGGAGSREIAGQIVGQPKLSLGGANEGLTRQQVMSVVQKHSAEVQRCYEKLLLSNPDLAGRMEFDWDISASGKVTDVRIKKSSVKGGDGLGECVKGVFKKMQFPTAKNGQSTTPNVGFPFGRL